MGTSESKMAASAVMKPEPAFKKTHTSHLIDPRSPSAGVDRTPIQVGGLESKMSEEKSECLQAFSDPRSPTIGVTRTPVRDVMRATVGSLARRLGMLFHNEADGKTTEGPQKGFSDAVEENLGGEELASTVPLLASQLPHNFGSLAAHASLLATPVLPPVQNMSNLSPFVLLEEPQVDVEIATEEDIGLEEAEEAIESPVHNRLSMSLTTCHEGLTSSQIYVEVHHESASFPDASVESLGDGVDHAYALPSITVEPKSSEPSHTTDVENSPVEESPVKPEEFPKLSPSEESSPSEPPAVPSLQQPQVCIGIRCPTFDIKSPSQVEFKPQWLGKGFGATGLRTRGVQGHSGKGGSSPLAVRVAVKNVNNENKGQSGKLKQKGTEGRSPLQILKETNSPRDKRSQMKLKVSTQEKQRLGQMDRRALVLSLDKENR